MKIRTASVLLLTIAAMASLRCEGGAVVPSVRMREWQDCEIGVIIHYDVQVHEPDFDFRAKRGYVPKASVVNPSALDTDQWLEVAASAGAKYAILVAKHCSGFSLWPTKAHGYSIAASPWKDGKGDIVADFIASCRKYGVRPGLYASLGCNAYLGVDNNELVTEERKWPDYLAAVKTQLTELWTNYGELFEIWFDGGNLPPEKGGAEIIDLLLKLQPNAIVFQGDPARGDSVRWIGNENARAPESCYSRTDCGSSSDGVAVGDAAKYSGDLKGRYWCPGEADTPNRDHAHAFQTGWFWHPGEDDWVYPAENLLERYMTSVGRNCNMLIGLPVDNRGLIADRDAEELKKFGELVKGLYAKKVASTTRSSRMLTIDVPEGSRANLLSIQENLEFGERVHSCIFSGFDGKRWHMLADIANVGHRRLVTFKPGPWTRFRLDCWDSDGEPVYREVALYETALER